MPTINLTAEQRKVLISWLYSPRGYLKSRPVGGLETAEEWLVANPSGNLVQWKRDNDGGGWERVTPEGIVVSSQRNIEEMAALWFVVYVWDGVNLTPPQIPSEYPEWLTYFAIWKQSIQDGFLKIPQANRTIPVPIYDESGTQVEAWEQGYHLAVQVSFVDKASNPD